MDYRAAGEFAAGLWDDEIVPQLVDYIRIPNKSPMFDRDWAAHGYMEQAVVLMERWCRSKDVPGMAVEVVRLPGRTPLLLLDIPGTGDDVVLLYGHLDKQPEMTGWSSGLGPWTPVLKDDRLYGRGGADDGYACFASVAAILALKAQGIAHSRCVVMIEACEESGSYDLPHYVDHLAERIGRPSLVVCLDSGCGNYDQMWMTTSLRGLAGGELTVTVLEEGVHSGDASGVVPSSFRILRQLLSRLEDEATGRILPEGLHVAIPAERIEQAAVAASFLKDEIWTKFPFLPGMTPMDDALEALILNRTWRPALSVTGADGLPPLDSAGNVLRPHTALKLSLRIPPTLDPEAAGALVKQVLEADPPYGARVEFKLEKAGSGWNAPPLSPWLAQSVDEASRTWFGAPPAFMGEGGTIPFMGMLGAKFPGAQFLITGVLGPQSNAHGPNEFLHIPTGKKLTACVAKVIADHHQASARGLTRGVAAAGGHGQYGEDHGCC
jgi:acetylornithine deacetylase/succinyl-diaminopimelate desuccinylase-like protein